MSPSQYEFLLPGHKADRFFKGKKIIIIGDQFGHQPLTHFTWYLNSHDNIHPVSSALWFTEEGRVPTRFFFMMRLQSVFDCDITGQSMWAGGATNLAEHGIPPSSFKLQVDGHPKPSSSIYERIQPYFKAYYMHTPEIVFQWNNPHPAFLTKSPLHFSLTIAFSLTFLSIFVLLTPAFHLS